MGISLEKLWDELAESAEMEGRWRRLLEAFETGQEEEETAFGDFSELEAAQASALPGLPEEITATLAQEVDPPQAAMFSRRFHAVATLLEGLAAQRIEARLLRSGLIARAMGILADPIPRALRMRSLVDFYYSAAATLHHQVELAAAGRTPLSIPSLVEASPWRKVQPGLFHRHITGDGPQGPVHVNALRFDRARFKFRVRDLRTEGLAGEPFDRIAADAGAVAAISGGFFLYSEHDIEAPCSRHDPVGMLLAGGEVLWPPVFRRGLFGQDEKGHCHVRTPGLAGVLIKGPVELLVGAVNPRVRRIAGPSAFTRAWGAEVQHPGPSLTFYGRKVTASSQGGVHPVPLNGFVLCLPDRPEWRGLLAAFPPGQEVTYSLPDHGGKARLMDAVAAGPVLVSGGRRALDLPSEEFLPGVPPATFSGDETGDRNLLPRLAAGLTDDHEVVFAAVDGRNFDRALGMTLRDTGRLMRALGCRDAVNLDGGSSKRMVLNDRILDLPTTEVVTETNAQPEQDQPVRPVYTGVFVHTD